MSGVPTVLAVLFASVFLVWVGIMIRERLVKVPIRAAARSDESFKALFDKSPLGMNVWELSGTGTQCNQAFLDMLGYTREEYDQISYETLQARDYTDSDREILKQLVDTGRFGPHFKDYKHKDGHSVPVAVYGTIVTDSRGTKRIWSIIEDLTEQRRMERAIRESEERLNLALKSGRIGVWELDLSSGGLTWDETMPILFGTPDTKADLDTFLKSVHPDDLTRIAAGIERASERGDFEAEYRIRRGDGETRFLKSRARFFEPVDGQPARLIGTTWDITSEHRVAQALITAKETAEEASRAKAEFLATMSHEIRTPLNGIMGMAELLLNSHLPDDHGQYAETILQCGHDLLAIINDILDFSQIETGRLEFQIIPFDPVEVIDQVTAKARKRLEERPINLHIEIDEAIPRAVMGDPIRIRQILMNLTDNAVKFTSEGRIDLVVAVDAHDGDQLTLRFTVSDTGIGIEREDIGKLFSPFTQVDSSSTRSFGGTGLGLAISKCLVEGMNGHITVQSERDRGSTFSFTVQLQETHVTERESEDARDRGAVLLVAGPAERARLGETLAGWDLHVDHRASGLDALELLRSEQKRYRALIVDQQIPKISGLDLIRILVADPQSRQIEIVMLGTEDDRDALDAARQLGVGHTLIRPFETEELASTLQESGLTVGPVSEREREVIPGTLHPPPRGRWQILIVNATEQPRRELASQLESLGVAPDLAETGMEALAFTKTRAYDLVLVDAALPDMTGPEVVGVFRELEREGSLAGCCPAIGIVGDDGSPRDAFTEAGAVAVLDRPLSPPALIAALNRWLVADSSRAGA